VTSELQKRRAVVRFMKRLHARNLLAANDGNISVRLDGLRVLVTASGGHKAFMKPEELVEVDLEGNVLSGTRKPTGELAMHLEVMRRRPEIQAVVHAHPPTCIALSVVERQSLNGILPEVILSTGEVPIVPYARPVSKAMADALDPFIDDHDALILERHGTLALGRTLLDAYALTERMEHAAEVLYRAHAFGRIRLLPRSEERELKELYERNRAETARLAR
jgi:L-fuculose-phosphate aldolase